MKFIALVSFLSLGSTANAFAPIAQAGSKILGSTISPMEEIVETKDWLKEEFHHAEPTDLFAAFPSSKSPEDHDWFPQAIGSYQGTAFEGVQIGDSKAALGRSAFDATIAPSAPPASPAVDSMSIYHAQPMASLGSPNAMGSRGQVEWFSQSKPEDVATTQHSQLDTSGASEWFMQAIN